MAQCSIVGVWDSVRNAPYLSREQWRAFNLLILCELIGGTPFMGSCTVDGLWNQVRGFPPFISEQEFMAENINLLCQLLTGGMGPGSTTVIRSGHGAPDTPGGTLDAIYFDIDCTSLWLWNALALTWTEMDIGKATGNYVVPTVVEVRQLDTSTCPPIKVETFGRDVVGDDQASVYRWDPDSLDADTGMSVLMPNDKDALTPGRWIQVVFA